MFEVRNALKQALSGIDGVTVISSSWRASRKQYSLPGIIVDWDATTPQTTTEDGEVILRQYSFPITAVVALTNVSDDDAEAALDALVTSIVSVLDAEVGKDSYSIQNWFPLNIPWGRVEAFSGSFQVLIQL